MIDEHNEFFNKEAARNPVILAVDDSPVVLKSVSSVLSDSYKVYTLTESAKIENVLKHLTPDLFLLDCMMPALDGFELARIIRSFSEHEETPIIFLTSEGTLENVSAAIDAGANDFIVKPFNPGELRERIAMWIAKKKY